MNLNKIRKGRDDFVDPENQGFIKDMMQNMIRKVFSILTALSVCSSALANGPNCLTSLEDVASYISGTEADKRAIFSRVRQRFSPATVSDADLLSALTSGRNASPSSRVQEILASNDFDVVATRGSYRVMDPQNQFYSEARLDGGYVHYEMNLRRVGPDGREIRNPLLRGQEQFRAALDYFGTRARGVIGDWRAGSGLEDNIGIFNRLTAPVAEGGEGISIEEAAMRTNTGQWARNAGYTDVTVTADGYPGHYTEVTAHFTNGSIAETTARVHRVEMIRRRPRLAITSSERLVPNGGLTPRWAPVRPRAPGAPISLGGNPNLNGTYVIRDSVQTRLGAEGHLLLDTEPHTLSLNLETRAADGGRSPVLPEDRQIWRDISSFFNGQFRRVELNLNENDFLLREMNRLTGPPNNMTVNQAIRQTEIGRSIMESRFQQISVVQEAGGPGHYQSLRLQFNH